MNASVKDQLQDIFGKWVTFEEHERLLYSHDVASLPGPVEKLVARWLMRLSCRRMPLRCSGW